MLNIGLAFLLAPLAAYFLYMGIQLFRINHVEFSKLVRLQSSEGFLSGEGGWLMRNGTSDIGIRYGLEISEDGASLLGKIRFSTAALKRVVPH